LSLVDAEDELGDTRFAVEGELPSDESGVQNPTISTSQRRDAS
jgi:hypothetical protein